jgi:hypothetical protein
MIATQTVIQCFYLKDLEGLKNLQGLDLRMFIIHPNQEKQWH